MMIDKLSELTITALQGGGFVVSSAYRMFVENKPFVPIFACTTIDEALAFIRENLADATSNHTEESRRGA